MSINSIYIKNFKCFEGEFILPLDKGINILVGDNEAGKSTIIQAIELVLNGYYEGKPIKSELSQYLYNYNVVRSYLESLTNGNKQAPPSIVIEIYFDEEIQPSFKGNNNYKEDDYCGVKFEIAFDERFNEEYVSLLNNGLKSLPLEYYEVKWTAFSREHILPKHIPLKSAIIDSSNLRTKNNNDLLLSRILKDSLKDEDIVALMQAYRKLQDSFASDTTVKPICENFQIDTLGLGEITLGINLSSRTQWEDYVTPYVNDIPFTYIGTGEQAIIKTHLSLSNKKANQASIILIEEPENHLSHSKLSSLLYAIKNRCSNKQIIVTTHSSFVANKLGLTSLILLSNRKFFKLNNLSQDTSDYFEKLPGFDTLRILLCKSSILVEGASDELVVQKLYMTLNEGRLPIQDGIDVISVNNLSFKRFLEIGKNLSLRMAVVTDNDGNIESLNDKYSDYLSYPNIKICYDDFVDERNELDGNRFNFNTLEPVLLRYNSINILNFVFGTCYTEEANLLKFMHKNKVDCALKIFNYIGNDVKFPVYLENAIKHCQIQ